MAVLRWVLCGVAASGPCSGWTSALAGPSVSRACSLGELWSRQLIHASPLRHKREFDGHVAWSIARSSGSTHALTSRPSKIWPPLRSIAATARSEPLGRGGSGPLRQSRLGFQHPRHDLELVGRQPRWPSELARIRGGHAFDPTRESRNSPTRGHSEGFKELGRNFAATRSLRLPALCLSSAHGSLHRLRNVPLRRLHGRREPPGVHERSGGWG
mmetsp:Transcript_51043/g.108439  ORF Transcript_51043/g.108439 Transcript_51043/m.108439 type:complete len:214 (-) Transcript_51043:1534-2175(-)